MAGGAGFINSGSNFIENMDLEIGAVEIKDGATDQRAGVTSYGELKVTIPLTGVAGALQLRCDYDGATDGRPRWVGFAARGVATSDTSWLLQRFTYDGNRQCTLRQIAYDSWDNHSTTAVYA